MNWVRAVLKKLETDPDCGLRTKNADWEAIHEATEQFTLQLMNRYPSGRIFGTNRMIPTLDLLPYAQKG